MNNSRIMGCLGLEHLLPGNVTIFYLHSSCRASLSMNLGKVNNFVMDVIGSMRLDGAKDNGGYSFREGTNGGLALPVKYYYALPTPITSYIADFDPEEDEEDPADHPVDGGDNDDNESSDDDDDNDDVVKDELDIRIE
ncbi:hypothetical protein Tco_0191074 [Tanacetum coccineum]